VRILLAACATALFVVACQSSSPQWTKPDVVSPERYDEDLTECNEEASVLAAQDMSGMPSGPEKTSALAVRRPTHFRTCMAAKGYSRIR
jgi:hypothetical protein